jgi:N-acetylglutamate synthase-like GNAT family acetyltransferase
MIEIRYVCLEDKEFWFSLDKHLSEQEFYNKVKDSKGYILLVDNKPVGLLRYNLFWDNIPFCNLIIIDNKNQGKSFGKQLIKYWENDMKSQEYKVVLTSTQVDETAQHFYRKMGYKDCGGLVMDIPGYEQPMELFLIKAI